MSNKKYSKEDIEAVFHTHFGEQSLIVLEMNKECSTQYTETALIKVPESKHFILKEIETWIASIPRFRDIFIYEKVEKPLRVRLKSIELPIEWIEIEKGFQNENQILHWLENQSLSFSIQQAPLFKIFVFNGPSNQWIACCYHHLLFDAISIQYVFSLLFENSLPNFKEWFPSHSIVKKDFENSFYAFHLQNYVPPSLHEKQDFFYDKLCISHLDYLEIMVRWVEFLMIATGEEQICVGEVFSFRNSEWEAQNALGFYVQTWPIVFKSQDNLLQTLKIQRSFILQHADEPVQNHFPPSLFDHCWVLEPVINTEIHAFFRTKPHYLLSIQIIPKHDTTELGFTWNLNKISSEAAKQIVRSFHQFLQNQYNFSKTNTPFSDKLIPILDIWKDNVKKYADKIAVKDSLGNEYTYKQLEELSDSLASQLNIKVQEPVGIRTTHSANFVIAILAVLKKRGIYVPLDPEIPKERYQYILNDAQIQWIISDWEISFSHVLHPLCNPKEDIPQTQNISSDLQDIVYLIYTSGTTGKPKGCAVTHQNLCNLFLGSFKVFDFHHQDRWVLFHSYGFDFSTWEVWGALLSGAMLYIPNREEVKNTFELYDLLIREKITILNQTPKAFDNLMLVTEHFNSLPDVRYIILGGDKLNLQKVFHWKVFNPHIQLVNMYGITETTVHVTYKKIEDEEIFSNIGNPLPGYTLSVCNSKKQRVPDGFIGEFIVEGNGVCKGYFLNPHQTYEKFDFSETPFYRSGDLGWRMNNDFYYLGRNDRQIKIRGYRVELGEIEFILQKYFHSTFRVLFIQETQLVAFHTCSFDINRNMSKEYLPDYANPSTFIRLNEMPLNVNGKTDDKALEAIFKNLHLPSKLPHDNHSSLLQSYLLKILGNSIHFNKSFIENGGDSISAIRLINALKKENLHLSIQDLFSTNKLSDLPIKKMNPPVKKIHWKNHTLIDAYNQSHEDKITGIFPLTQAQLGILYESLIHSDNTYTVQIVLRVSADITTPEIIEAYKKTLEALPVLQLKITQFQENYFWVLPQNPHWEIHLKDFDDDPQKLIQEDFYQSFDLFKNLVRITIIENKHHEKLLLWTHHHLLLDGWSLSIFCKYLMMSLNHQALTKQENFLYYLYEWKEQEKSEVKANYWKNRCLHSHSDILIPFCSSEDIHENNEFVLEIELNPIINDLKSQDLTYHQWIFSAWLAFLSTVFQKRNITLGNVVSLREEGLENEVGMLIQTLPFIVEVNPELDFLTFAIHVKNLLIQDYENKPFYFDDLDKSKINLDTLFVFENYPIDNSIFDKFLLKIEKIQEKTAAKWTIIFYPNPEKLKIRVLFDNRYYSKDYVQSVLHRFDEFIQSIAWDKSLREIKNSLSQQPFLEGKSSSVLTSENLFIHFTRNSNIKIQKELISMDYYQIMEKVNEIANQFLAEGVLKNEAIGIEVQSTVHFVIAVLSIWKVNAVPCSVDYQYPQSRKLFIWKNASCRWIIQENNHQLQIKRNHETPYQHAEKSAFILHTSGSTGSPKGVIQTYDCLIHLAHWTSTQLDLNADEKILALSSYGFDASYHEMILWLSLGATYVEMPYELRQDIHQIKNYILNYQITLAWIPAKLLNAILDIDPFYFEECISLKQIVTTGEALIINSNLKNWILRKNIKLFNFYGPTETHVVTAKIIDKNNISTIPDIGKPIYNAVVGIFDQNQEKVPAGLIGEIYIAGPYLAHQYLNDKKLTNQKFFTQNNIRWYKTGDLGRVKNDGNLQYLGRIDDQIKIRGFRVEPFEVETLLHQVEGIQQATIVVHKQQDTQLIAFWIGTPMNDIEFRNACSKILPDFMIPEVQVRINEFPRNINGKIDKKRLLENYLSDLKIKKQESKSSLHSSKAFHSWEFVLGHSHFNENSHFLSVGGNSIKIMKLQAWLQKNYQIIISIKELYQNLTFIDFQQLINHKLQEQRVSLPDQFPLNAIQKDIWMIEKGNSLKENSPFLLSFSFQFLNPISSQSFHFAVQSIFDIYPHLAYVIENTEDLNEVHWTKNPHFLDFVYQPLSYKSLENREPLLRIFWENNSIYVQWHHILLDAVGISMVMQAFYDALTNNHDFVPKNYKNFLEQSHIQNLAKVKISHKKSIVLEKNYPNDAKIYFHRLAESLGYTVQDFFILLTFSVFESAQVMAFTDNHYQLGLPGMFTFLNTCKALFSEESLPILQKNIYTEEPVSCVFNFMYAPEIPDNVTIRFENALPQFCKYPYEIQITVYKETLNIQLIFEWDNPTAKEKSDLFFDKLDRILKGESFKEVIQTKLEQIHFDDFDF